MSNLVYLCVVDLDSAETWADDGSVQDWDDDLEDVDWEALLAEPDDVIDALDKPPCPFCDSAQYSLDSELHAWICDSCGYWHNDVPEDLPPL